MYQICLDLFDAFNSQYFQDLSLHLTAQQLTLPFPRWGKSFTWTQLPFLGLQLRIFLLQQFSGPFWENSRYLREKKDLALWNSAFQPCIPCNDNGPLNRDANWNSNHTGYRKCHDLRNRSCYRGLCLSPR